MHAAADFCFPKQVRLEFSGDSAAVQSLAFGDGLLFTAGEDRRIKSWRAAGSEWVIGAQTGAMSGLCTALHVGAGLVLAGFEDGTVMTWLTRAFLLSPVAQPVAPLRSLAHHADTVWAVTLVGDHFVTGDAQARCLSHAAWLARCAKVSC
jgi:hypothetical protein